MHKIYRIYPTVQKVSKNPLSKVEKETDGIKEVRERYDFALKKKEFVR